MWIWALLVENIIESAVSALFVRILICANLNLQWQFHNQRMHKVYGSNEFRMKSICSLSPSYSIVCLQMSSAFHQFDASKKQIANMI